MTATNTPLVSVIVLSYNSADTIEQALDSVLAQRCAFGVEVLVGDDGSSDGTQRILRSYADRYPDTVRLLLSAENRGVQANYFDCLEAARGEFIADCAGDDYWCGTERLQRLVDALTAAPQAVASFSDWQCLHVADGSLTDAAPRLCRNVARGEMLLPLLASCSSPAWHLSASVFRRAAVMPDYERRRDSLYRNAAYACEDLQVMAALADAGPMVYVPGPTLVYRVGHAAAITSASDAGRAARFALSSLALVRALAQRFGLATHPDVAARIAVLCRFALSQAALSGDSGLARRAAGECGQVSGLPLPTRMLRVALSVPGGPRMVKALKTLKSYAKKRENR
ncbi:MAG: glycosyltransferase [Muribaculaceae bacterium]|nr:glycosyltransferase [Muribaculaceae bacterium]